MRRKDREVTNRTQLADIINRCICCRIGFNDEGRVYIVPLNFGYEKKEDSFVFYFHGAHEGRKIDLIYKSPYVGFEMDTNYKLNESETACGYSARFQSIIGNGAVKIVDDMEEKLHGLNLIMEHNAGANRWDFDTKMLNAVTVFKLEADEISCKEHQ